MEFFSLLQLIKHLDIHAYYCRGSSYISLAPEELLNHLSQSRYGSVKLR